jgi:uncharacterized protein
MPRISRRCLVGATAVLLAIGPRTLARAQVRRITIGTNPQGTEYYVVGGGLAKMFSEKLGVQSIVQPYAGSSVYLPLIQDGEVTMGLSSSLDSGGAYRGEQGRSPMTKLRALARLWPLPYGYIVRGDSGIRTIADLRGRRVVIDIRANAALADVNRAMLAVGGLADADVRPVTIGGVPQGVQAVVEGTADASPVAVGIPTTREANASVAGGVRYVSLTGPNANDSFLGEKAAGVFAFTVQPAANLPEVPEPVTVSAFDVFLVTSADLSAGDTERLLATLRENFAALQQDYPSLRRGDPAKLGSATNTVPYHPAAIAFLKAQNLWTGANDAHEQRITRR